MTNLFIDSIHDIPRGSSLVYSDEVILGDDDDNSSVETEVEQEAFSQEVYGPSSSAEESLDAPTGLVVKSRSVRFTADGRVVVDLVLTVNDVENADRYEVRVGKE